MESEGGHGVLRSPFLLPFTLPPHPCLCLPGQTENPPKWSWAAAPVFVCGEQILGFPSGFPTQPATPSPALMPTSLRRNSLQGALV